MCTSLFLEYGEGRADDGDCKGKSTMQIKGGKAAEGLWVFLFGKMKKKYSKNVEKQKKLKIEEK